VSTGELSRRATNRRGQGGALRGEILDAATRLLADASARGAVTLRAIAREAGIAAPSIYRHFPDRDAILDAVVSQTFVELSHACEAAAEGAPAGAGTVEAVCRAYLDFARDHPGPYRVIFARSPADIASPPTTYPDGIAAFELLRRAVAQCDERETSTAREVTRDAQCLLAALHGLATLVPATPGFPWIGVDTAVHRLVGALAVPLTRSGPGRR